MKSKIYADDREDGGVLEEFSNSGLNVVVKRLKCGDYVMDDIVIERKTINDFTTSLMNGRLKAQTERMLANFNHCYVLISGKLADRRSEINENCIIGKMVSILLSGVNIVCLDNDTQLVYMMKRIFERYIELQGGEKECQEKE